MIFFAPGAGWRVRRYYFSRGRLKSLIQLDFITVLEGNIAPPAPRPADPQIGPPQPPKDGVMIFFRGRAWPERRYDFFSRPGLAGTAL